VQLQVIHVQLQAIHVQLQVIHVQLQVIHVQSQACPHRRMSPLPGLRLTDSYSRYTWYRQQSR